LAVSWWQCTYRYSNLAKFFELIYDELKTLFTSVKENHQYGI